jgi:hypothetical protein
MIKIVKKLLFVLNIGVFFVASQAFASDCGKKACCDDSAKAAEHCETEACKDSTCDTKEPSEMHAE